MVCYRNILKKEMKIKYHIVTDKFLFDIPFDDQYILPFQKEKQYHVMIQRFYHHGNIAKIHVRVNAHDTSEKEPHISATFPMTLNPMDIKLDPSVPMLDPPKLNPPQDFIKKIWYEYIIKTIQKFVETYVHDGPIVLLQYIDSYTRLHQENHVKQTIVDECDLKSE